MMRFLFTALVAVFILSACRDTPQRQPQKTPSKIGLEKKANASHEGEGVPSYALKVLDHVRAHQEAPEGYVGGRSFQNREKRLPQRDNQGKTIRYREWDVHPRINGENRGSERLVTGSDQSAWYTADHYRTFVKIE